GFQFADHTVSVRSANAAPSGGWRSTTMTGPRAAPSTWWPDASGAWHSLFSAVRGKRCFAPASESATFCGRRRNGWRNRDVARSGASRSKWPATTPRHVLHVSMLPAWRESVGAKLYVDRHGRFHVAPAVSVWPNRVWALSTARLRDAPWKARWRWPAATSGRRVFLRGY